MSDKITKILSISLYAVIGISVFFLVLFYFELFTVGLLLYWTYLLIAIATVLSVVFPVLFMIQNPKGVKKTLVGIGVMILFFLVAYLIASDEVLPKYEKYGVDPSISKQVGMGLIATYLLGLGAIGAIIYSAISRIFK